MEIQFKKITDLKNSTDSLMIAAPFLLQRKIYADLYCQISVLSSILTGAKINCLIISKRNITIVTAVVL